MSKLKSMLLVSYFFPPIGMAGSARAYGLFRYLPEFGYQPYVVTVRDIVYPAYDTTLLSEEDESYIDRTESFDPSRLLWRIGRRKTPAPSHAKYLSEWITPDYKSLWTGFGIAAARKILDDQDIKIVMTTSPSPSAHIVGQALRKSCDVKWLADFRDMWVTKPIEDAYLRESQKVKCRKLLNGFRNSADHVTAVNNSIARYTKADTVITNAVDPLTVDLWDVNASSDTTDSRFRIGYLGTTDSADTIGVFVGALAGALKKRQSAPDILTVRFVGAVDEDMLRECFASAGLLQALECRGYLPRHSAIEALADVDALLVTIPEELSYVTPSKVFDCLVSGKPLIVIAPRDSELAGVAKESGERCFAKDEKAALQGYLEQLMDSKDKAGASRSSAEFVDEIARRRERHTWRAMAKSFADVFDGMLINK